MSFFVKFLARLTHTIISQDALKSSNLDDALFHSAIMMSNLFDGVARNDSLAAFATLGGLGEHGQEYILDKLIAGVIENWDKVLDAALKRYPDLSLRTLQPYVTANSPPNIISPLHLCTQALCAENVFPFRETKLTPSRI